MGAGGGTGRLARALMFVALLPGKGQPFEDPSPNPSAPEEEVGKSERSPFLADPSLGGKLHLTYRLTYEGKFFRYHPYRFNFPGDVSPLDVQAASELEARHRDRSTDHDLDQYLSIRTRDLFVPSKETGYVQGLDTDFSVRYFQDLDGSPTGDEAASTYDFVDSNERLQLRTLNARLKLFSRHLEVAGGRLPIDGAERVLLDGAQATARGLAFLGIPFEVSGFVGARVSFFRTVPRSTVWGGALRIWPWQDGELEIENLYFFENSLQVTFEQRFVDGFTARAIYRQLDEDPESMAVELLFERGGLALRGEYHGKFGLDAKDFLYDYITPTDAPGGDLEPFRYFNLGDLDPFHEGTLEARWSPSGNLGFFLGGTAHVLASSGVEDQFNTDWYEVWGGADTSHFPWEGLTSRATVRYLSTDLPRRVPAFSDPLLVADVRADGEPDFVGVELLLEQDLARRVRLGSTLEVKFYRYDSRFALTEFWGLGATAYARYRQNRYLSYSLVYAYDRDYEFINPDLEDVHGVRLEIVFGF